MLDAQETLEHGGSRRTDPHPEVVIEGHSGPADVLCQVESKSEDKVAAVTSYGRFASSRRRAARRPFRPPWRNRFSLGRSSFGGRSFFFMAATRRRTGRGLRKPPTLDAWCQPAPLSRMTGFRWRCGRARSRRTPAMRVGSASPETCDEFGCLSESVSGGRSGRACTACRNGGLAGGAGLPWSSGCKVSTTR